MIPIFHYSIIPIVSEANYVLERVFDRFFENIFQLLIYINKMLI